MPKNNQLYSKVVDQGLDKRKLAIILGISYTSIINKFLGKSPWSIGEVTILKKVLNLTPDEVVDIFLI